MIVVHAGCSSTPEFLDVATTPDIAHSGLLDDLRLHFGEAMRVHVSDSDRAARMLEDEVVDLVIGRASDEMRRSAGHEPTWVYRAFAYNHTVLIGPVTDPARVRGAADGVDAFRRIAASSSPFISHGRDADILALEEFFLRNALFGQPPARSRTSRQGVTGTLRMASDYEGYTLVNEALFRRFEKGLDLAVLFRHDTRLLHMYAVIHRCDDRRAGRFGEWLTRGDGRQRIADFRLHGQSVFTVWPEGCPDSPLERQPCRLNAGGKPIKDEIIYAHAMGPPATLRAMTSEADAVIVARFTGRSREFPTAASTSDVPSPPRSDRLGEFEILEVVKPHPAVPAVAARVEIAVPGSYQEFRTYILHTFADGTDEPVAGRTYVIFVRHLRARGDEWLASAWSAYGTFDISGDHVKALRSGATADGSRTEEFLAEVRRAPPESR